MLREGRRLRVADLVHEFGVTDTSIRRDLAILEANGVLLRVHGGAVARASELRPRPVTDRMRLHLAEKQRIGEAAARLIEPGEIVLFDSGTTTLQVAAHIPPSLRTSGMLTIITNSLRLAEDVLTWPAPNLILLGGLCVPDYQAIVGTQALEQLEHLMVDKVFLGVDGLTLTDGATTADILMAELNRRMAERRPPGDPGDRQQQARARRIRTDRPGQPDPPSGDRQRCAGRSWSEALRAEGVQVDLRLGRNDPPGAGFTECAPLPSGKRDARTASGPGSDPGGRGGRRPEGPPGHEGGAGGASRIQAARPSLGALHDGGSEAQRSPMVGRQGGIVLRS